MKRVLTRLLFASIIAIAASVFARADVELDGAYVVEASFISTAPVEVIWGVLTDYDNINKFVSVIKESEYKDGVLHQKVVGNWWFFRKTVTLDLEIKELKHQYIGFESIATDGSFSIYRGAWTIEDNDVVKISYTLLARPNFFVPKGIIRNVLRKQTQVYIEEVEKEIKRRLE